MLEDINIKTFESSHDIQEDGFADMQIGQVQIK